MENSLVLINDFKNIYASVRAFRYSFELEYYNAEINKRAPKMIGAKEDFFSTIGKKITNSFNSLGYNDYVEKRDKVLKLLKTLEDENTIYKDEELKNKLDSLFINDKTGVAKLEFGMDIILDNSYKFEVNEYSYKKLSIMLNESEEYLAKLEGDMKKAYLEISLNKTNFKKDAIIAGSLISFVVIASGVGGVLGAAAGAGLASLGLSLAEGLSILALGSAAITASSILLTYKGLKESEKSKIKKEFQSLNIEEATIALVKTVLAIIHLKDNINDTNKELYDAYIEEYLDLKSDVDLSLFLDEYKVEENKNKNKLFSNADEMLKKRLFN